ncbi:venom serine carboxypeptidase-like [Amyelois transitella]|uniref:venom serine carboxypeptidase-like n=1 Tax=Amyelois transitella TaxID=680683 RepID=UPI00298FF303|nr:venom serine carboxypeptidase-like [Amyelois transitella]
MNAVICAVCLIVSVYGRVAVVEEKLSDISENLIIDDKLLEIESTTDQPKVLAKNDKTDLCLDVNSINNTINETTAEQLACLYKLLNSTVINLNETKTDNGVALILTPLIEAGNIEEARNASKVDPEQFLGLESYSGFFTVNKTYNSNLFFWYFPVENKPVNETPWVIWLQGGPGASSLTGLFDEIGPLTVENGRIARNRYSWLQNHSLVFIDNPVGTGFSFTDHPDGFTQDSTTYGHHLYTAFKQFILVFPELKSAPLFVAGESYAGKYVPALAAEIHTHMDETDGKVKMEGMMIGNAYVEPSMISQLAKPFYHFGLLVKEQLDIVKPLVDAFHEDIAANRSIEAKEKFTGLITILLFLTHQKQGYNFLKDDISAGHYSSYLEQSVVRKALHVGDIGFSFVNMTVNSRLAPDFLSNARPKFEMLLDHYRVLTYCGQLDQMLPCAYTSESYRQWKWKHSQEFLDATRYPYIYNKKLAGYHKTGGGLTEVLIRGAGHMAPMDKPGATQELVSRWTHQQPLSSGFGVLEGSFVQEFIKNYTNSIYL